MTDRDPGVLLDILEEARELGLLGPGPVARQYEHALDLAQGIGEFDGRVLDLGSGGGLPGLVLFDVWPEASGVLLDAQRRRCDFLARAVATLDLAPRVAVECGRAEALARDRTAAGQLRSRRRPVVRTPQRSRPSARSGFSGAPARWW